MRDEHSMSLVIFSRRQYLHILTYNPAVHVKCTFHYFIDTSMLCQPQCSVIVYLLPFTLGIYIQSISGTFNQGNYTLMSKDKKKINRII